MADNAYSLSREANEAIKRGESVVAILASGAEVPVANTTVVSGVVTIVTPGRATFYVAESKIVAFKAVKPANINWDAVNGADADIPSTRGWREAD